MSNVRGKISIDVQFADSTTSAGVQSLKTITLQDTTEYTSGKVAVVTGTVGTAAVIVFPGNTPTTYKDAAGNPVAVSPSRLVFSATGDNLVLLQGDAFQVHTRRGRASVCEPPSDDPMTAQVLPETGGSNATASYTLVLYGE